MVNLTMVLDMVAEAMPDRVLIGDAQAGLTGAQLRARAVAAGRYLHGVGTGPVVYLGGNGPLFPVALFGSGYAGRALLPLNFRLPAEQIEEIIARQEDATILTGEAHTISRGNVKSETEFTRMSFQPADRAALAEPDPESIAVLLMTSGTTAAPKSAVLRHTHLVSYILSSVEFMSAQETDATLVSVPPYHIAAVANLLSNLYAGRRIFYLDKFTAAEWLDTVDAQGITNAMVVPTMLARIVAELEATGAPAPRSLRTLAYGGAKTSEKVLRRALGLFPHTGFVNAYGLTETASSIAVLGPEDHREAMSSSDPLVQARLGSVGRPLPGVEIEIHDDNGRSLAAGETGDIVVRGPQVAGEYLGSASRLSEEDWFHTRDRGWMDASGFIFVQGRADDTIIRGGENIAPAEIEQVLASHDLVADCAVVGVPDEEWGERIAAFLVPAPGKDIDVDDFRNWARSRLRSSKTPDQVVVVKELPTTPTGKILRRDLVRMIVESLQSPPQ